MPWCLAGWKNTFQMVARAAAKTGQPELGPEGWGTLGQWRVGQGHSEGWRGLDRLECGQRKIVWQRSSDRQTGPGLRRAPSTGWGHESSLPIMGNHSAEGF